LTPEAGRLGGERGEKSLLFQDLALVILAVLILVVPALLEAPREGPFVLEETAVEPALIDINRAPWHEWTLLEGIGEARARSIVLFREAHGPFGSIDDLNRVPRMPAGWLERARRHLEVRE
jgi:competence protein ComEA